MTWICGPPARSLNRSAFVSSAPHQRTGATAALTGWANASAASAQTRANERRTRHRVPEAGHHPVMAGDVDRLYELPLGEFTAARNALAKELSDPEGRKLKKPSVAAWAGNP